jgi:hypothetical protein
MTIKPLAAACAAFALVPAFAAGPFDQFKGKVKEGQYEIKTEMEMPGMPAGMGKQARTITHCVTKEDLDRGDFGKGGKNGGMPENCEVKDFNMTGNNASYRMACKANDKGSPEMTVDTKMTFRDNGYTMDMKMAMNQGGQVMNMTQHMDSRYLGPCTKK